MISPSPNEKSIFIMHGKIGLPKLQKFKFEL